jgi:hypothetical protein
MSEFSVSEEIVKATEYQFSIKNLQSLGPCNYLFPGEKIFHKTISSEKNCTTCPLFYDALKYCKNHMEFLAAPEYTICEDYNDIKKYTESKERNSFLYTNEEGIR